MHAIWFSRHEPTPVQLAEIESLGFTLVAIPAGQILGSRSLENDKDVEDLITDIHLLAWENSADAYFGVWPAPIQARISAEPHGYPCYAAWNVTRTPDGGGKPTFRHHRWCLVGTL